jgi:hypothetical protein
MKKLSVACAFALVLVFATCSVAAETAMPEKMAKSVLQLREGIIDMGDTTVGSFFLNKKFLSNQQLDGTVSTAQYGKASLSGNNFTLDIDVVNGTNKIATMTFILTHLGKTTLLSRVKINTYGAGENLDSTDFNDKFQMLKMFKSLIDAS